jgi:hypothetical protein
MCNLGDISAKDKDRENLLEIAETESRRKTFNPIEPHNLIKSNVPTRALNHRDRHRTEPIKSSLDHAMLISENGKLNMI